LDVGLHPRVRLGHAAKLGLPNRYPGSPVDVAPAGVGLPAAGPRRVELHVVGGTGGVVGVEYRLDGTRAHQFAGDGGGNALASHVGQFLVHELGGIGAALADQAGVEPLLGDPLELSEKVEFGIFPRVAPTWYRSGASPGEIAAWIAAYRPGAPA